MPVLDSSKFETLGELIKDSRAQRHEITCEEVAHRIRNTGKKLIVEHWTYRRYENDWYVKPKKEIIDAILQVLEISLPADERRRLVQASIDVANNRRTEDKKSPFRVLGITEFLEHFNCSMVEAFERFINVDTTEVPELGDDDELEGTPEQWAKVHEMCPQFTKTIIDIERNNDIVGYFHAIPLKADAFARAKSGLLLESEIDEHIVPFLFRGDRINLYVPMFLIKRRYFIHSPELLELLKDAFAAELISLADLEGIYVQEICGNAFTPLGVNICERYRMNRTDNSLHEKLRGTKIFSKRLIPFPDDIDLGSYHSKVESIYKLLDIS